MLSLLIYKFGRVPCKCSEKLHRFKSFACFLFKESLDGALLPKPPIPTQMHFGGEFISLRHWYAPVSYLQHTWCYQEGKIQSVLQWVVHCLFVLVAIYRLTDSSAVMIWRQTQSGSRVHKWREHLTAALGNAIDFEKEQPSDRSLTDLRSFVENLSGDASWVLPLCCFQSGSCRSFWAGISGLSEWPLLCHHEPCTEMCLQKVKSSITLHSDHSAHSGLCKWFPFSSQIIILES